MWLSGMSTPDYNTINRFRGKRLQKTLQFIFTQDVLLLSVSCDGWSIENARHDAGYHYYLHGPLARMELGNDQLVQGVDYAYTLQGWLKEVNSQYLSPARDMGGDGKPASRRSVIGPDVYGYSLDYYNGDYLPVDHSKALPLSWIPGGSALPGRELYNGNIGRSVLSVGQFNNTVGYSYRYDQLNRLKRMLHHPLTAGDGSWSAFTADSIYKEVIAYDGNGNILQYYRNGSGANGKQRAMDNLSYGYSRDASGNLVNNRLLRVQDAVTSTEYSEDLRTQGENNYLYDSIGNLVKDVQGGITNIQWTVYGKIKSITKSDGSSLEYRYDPSGNRVYKGYTHGGITDKTWYVRDAQGNALSVYGNKNGGSQLYWKEQSLYGSSRLGVWEPDVAVSGGSADSIWDQAGRKHYELTNHLGNVLVTIGDQLSADGKAVVYSAQDYYPFGMLMPDRRYADDAYRYGFNGKENDGETGTQDYGMRIYKPGLGRFLSVDPISAKYPELTPYQFASNRPIDAVDLDGQEQIDYRLTYNKQTRKSVLYTEKVKDLPETNIFGQKYPGGELKKAVVQYGIFTYHIGFAGSSQGEIDIFDLWKQYPDAVLFTRLFPEDGERHNADLVQQFADARRQFYYNILSAVGFPFGFTDFEPAQAKRPDKTGQTPPTRQINREIKEVASGRGTPRYDRNGNQQVYRNRNNTAQEIKWDNSLEYEVSVPGKANTYRILKKEVGVDANGNPLYKYGWTNEHYETIHEFKPKTN